MPYYTAQQTIPTADNVAENYATNTWHFEADSEAILDDIVTAMRTFYSTVIASMSNLARSTNWTTKFYDDEDPEPRAPVYTETWNPSTSTGTTGLPPEVALCLSFQGAQISGVPQARRRGRIYIPFWSTASAGTDGRPSSSTVSMLATAGVTFLTTSDGAGTWHWVTSSQVAPGYSTVTNGWVDNEWDTQRRRGRAYTSRTTFT